MTDLFMNNTVCLAQSFCCKAVFILKLNRDGESVNISYHWKWHESNLVLIYIVQVFVLYICLQEWLLKDLTYSNITEERSSERTVAEVWIESEQVEK